LSLYNIEAVIIRSRNLGEADRLVTLYSYQQGKVRAVARGARRPRNRLRAGVELFTHGDYLLFANKGLDNISQCEIIGSFRELREDLLKAAAGAYVLELLDVFTEEGEPKGDLFPFLLAVLENLAQGEDLELTLRAAEVGFLARLGYRPELEKCVNCGAPLGEGVCFSVHQGGALCADCGRGVSDLLKVSAGALATLNYLLKMPFSRAVKLRVSPAMRAELKDTTVGLIRSQLGHDLKSAAFLALVKETNDSNQYDCTTGK
jgi:DNA repair protein RecO (recombination protein O)